MFSKGSVFSLHLNFIYLFTVSSSEMQASPNTNAVLPCNVTFPQSATVDNIEKSLINVSWMSNGSDIASSRETVTKIKEGFSWDISNFVNGDFSLTVLRAELSLQGVYECTVSYNSTMLHSSNVTLNIVGMLLFSFLDLFAHLKPKFGLVQVGSDEVLIHIAYSR